MTDVAEISAVRFYDRFADRQTQGPYHRSRSGPMRASRAGCRSRCPYAVRKRRRP